jgi:hypothetical protein
MKTHNNFLIISKLVWDCCQSLIKLEEHNRIQLAWLPGHMGIDENEIADQLARQGSSCPLRGPEPTLDISAKFARQVIRSWTNRKPEGFTDRSKLRASLNDLLLKELENYST